MAQSVRQGMCVKLPGQTSIRVYSLALFRLGEIDHYLGKWDAAREKYQQSIAAGRQSGDLAGNSAAARFLNELPDGHA